MCIRDSEYSEEFLGISCNNNATTGFDGIFDGDGHAVHKMKISIVEWTTPPSDGKLGTVVGSGNKMYQGFIGRLDKNGVLKNFTLADDCDIVVSGYSGGIVGYSFGRIENCVNHADVVSYSGIYVGGVAGYVNSTETAVVENCLNTGDITGGRYGVGGVTGCNYGLLKGCANTGDVTAKDLVTNWGQKTHYLVGGITGTMTGRIDNCINYGTVTGNDRVGGLTGNMAHATGNFIYYNDVVNSINLGIVYCADVTQSGAIGGVSGSTAEVSGNYFDKQIIPLKAAGNASAKGIEGVETSKLVSGTPLDGYDAALWDFQAGLYPSLKAFKNNESVKKARSIIVTIPAGKNAYDLTNVKADLAQAEGLKWSLASDGKFTIADNQLSGPESVTELVTDTLVADFGSIRKPILIKALPAIPLKGEGTEASPYLLSTPDEWNALALYMSQTTNSLEEKYVAVANDIDFTGKEFTPLAFDGATYFNGTLDGKGHTVKGISYKTTATYQGAIKVIGSTATVKNLTLSGEITSAFANTGGFAAQIYGSLSNCVNNIKVTSTKATAGGFAATLYNTASLTKCVNKAAIAAVSSVGGIAGTFDKDSKVVLTECANEGLIKGNSNSAYVGGMVGTAYPSTLKDCVNSGEITVTNTANQSFAAGMIGYANGASKALPYEIEGCINSGNVTAKSGCAGIVSNVNATAGNTVLHITGCENSGVITANASSNVSNSANAGIAALLTPGSYIRDSHNKGRIDVAVNTYTGGIAGYARTAPSNAANGILISGCSNTAEVSGRSYNVGGIMGNVAAYTTVENCFNTGKVSNNGTTSSTGYGTGGVAGALTNVNGKITGCWNSGNISGLNRVGGIVGMNAQKANVTECFNTGDISSTTQTAGTTGTSGYGIGGIAGQGASVFSKCVNFGTVSGASRVGGVIGVPSKNNTQLSDSYNAGKIIADADTCGNLIGVKLTGNGSIWSETNTITNCYYVKEFGTYANNGEFGKSVSFGELAKTNIGDGWKTAGEYCLPLPVLFAENQTALLYSAAVVTAPEDSFELVTAAFNVGTPAGVLWTSSVSQLGISGNDARFNADYKGEIVLTATNSEGMKRTVTLNADAKASGIEDIDVDEAEAEYYTVDGLRVAEPTEGEVYIMRKGKKTSKVIYRR